MAHVVNNSSYKQCKDVEFLQAVLELEHPDEGVGHLCHAETVEEVVKRDGQIGAVDGTDPVVHDVHVDVQ